MAEADGGAPERRHRRPSHPSSCIRWRRSISTRRSRRRAISARWRTGSASAPMPPASRSTPPALKGKTDILSHMDMIVAAGGGERDLAVDSAILSGIAGCAKSGGVPQRTADERSAADLFLAQLSNLLAGNISIVHGVTGSSRTFMGEEASGVDAVRIALSRIAAGQSDIALVGGAHNGERPDLLMLYEFGRHQSERPLRAGLGARRQRRLCARLARRIPGDRGARACREARRQAAGAAYRRALRPLQPPAGRRHRRARRGCGTRSRTRSKPATPRCFPAPPAPRPPPPRNGPFSARMPTLPCAPPVPISVMGWSRNSR